MKRLIALSLAALTLLLTLAGCSGSKPQTSTPSMTPEERTEAYKTAIESARDDETNQFLPVITSMDDDMADFLLPMVGITDDNAVSYGVSVSAMIVRAYGVVAVMPAEGKAQEVLDGLQGFVDMQKQNFNLYLEDQYEIASNAKLETLADGTILLVMCEDQDQVFQTIKDTLQKG